MKVADIKAGGIYHDGKLGIREITRVTAGAQRSQDRVEYRILAAKVTQEYSYAEKQMMPVIGTTATCTVASFAAWAKVSLSAEACATLLTELAAAKLKLTPGEVAYLTALAAQVTSAALSGAKVQLVASDSRRPVTGLTNKGLLVCHPDNVLELTSLAAAWLRKAAPS